MLLDERVSRWLLHCFYIQNNPVNRVRPAICVQIEEVIDCTKVDQISLVIFLEVSRAKESLELIEHIPQE